MAVLNLDEIMRGVSGLEEADQWRLLVALAERVVGRAKGSAKGLLGTLEPASSIDPQERVRRLREEWDV